jgi:GDP-D-mannose 3', 5'-epimerase
MCSTYSGPLNVGSDEMVTINQLVRIVTNIAGKKLTVVHKDGPLGVRGRNSDNRLIEEKLGWSPAQSLRIGLERTYEWVEQQVHRNAA